MNFDALCSKAAYATVEKRGDHGYLLTRALKVTHKRVAAIFTIMSKDLYEKLRTAGIYSVRGPMKASVAVSILVQLIMIVKLERVQKTDGVN